MGFFHCDLIFFSCIIFSHKEPYKKSKINDFALNEEDVLGTHRTATKENTKGIEIWDWYSWLIVVSIAVENIIAKSNKNIKLIIYNSEWLNKSY